MAAARWRNELLLGCRMALAGGRSGLARAALTALGVGLGVALLLAAVSLPNVLDAQHQRTAARDDLSVGGPQPIPGGGTILVGWADTHYHSKRIRGRLLQPEGAQAPVPPGLTALPPAGSMVVSPALRRLLESPDGALLRERLDYQIVGTIGDEGLRDPTELAFYAGTATLHADNPNVIRRDHFGEEYVNDGLDPVLTMIVVIIFVVLLLPVALFVAAAVRFGGESRDRRLAGVRLVGADVRMTRRIAAGEALLSALGGLVVGATVFLAGRTLTDDVSVMGTSAFPSDVTPEPVLALLIAVAVPAAAVATTVLSLRRVAIEPLGVARRAGDARRRLWWRLIAPAIGALLLLPLAGQISTASADINEAQVGAGVCLILVGVATLLPWLVQATVRRIRGGPVSWQLAIRRLQLDGSTSARAVMAVAVATAGAIALQMVFATAQANYLTSTGQDPSRAQAIVQLDDNGLAQAPKIEARLRQTPGVTDVVTVNTVTVAASPAPGSPEAGGDHPLTMATIGECRALREFAHLDRCADGDIFIVRGERSGSYTPVPGTVAAIQHGDGDGAPEGGGGAATAPLPIPEGTPVVTGRPGPAGGGTEGLLVTPGALPARSLPFVHGGLQSFIRLDPAVPDAIEHVANSAWRIDPLGSVTALVAQVEKSRFQRIRLGLYAGATLTLLLIGASLLVTVIEQLRDRRRLLAILVAFGTRRSTLACSVLWQTAVPVALGLALAIVAGLVLGAVLLRAISAPFTVDWSIVAVMSAIAASVVFLVTVLSLPMLWRLMRADGLRTE